MPIAMLFMGSMSLHGAIGTAGDVPMRDERTVSMSGHSSGNVSAIS